MSQSQFQEHSTTPNREFKDSLVDSSFTSKDTGTSYVDNHPYDDDTTQEGGYGGDPFTRRNQTNYDRGQFGGIATPAEPADDRAHGENAGEEDFDRPSEGSATLASSSGTGAEAQLRGHREMNPDNIGA